MPLRAFWLARKTAFTRVLSLPDLSTVRLDRLCTHNWLPPACPKFLGKIKLTVEATLTQFFTFFFNFETDHDNSSFYSSYRYNTSENPIAYNNIQILSISF